MSARDHVLEFLAPVDGHRAFATAALMLARRAETNPRLARALNDLARQIRQTPLVGARHSALDARLRARVAEPLEMPGVPDFVRPVLVAVYQRAKAALRSGDAARKIRNVDEAAVERVGRVLHRLERDFIGELLVETRRRAVNDRRVARQLRSEGMEINAMGRHLDAITRRFMVRTTVCREGLGGTRECHALAPWVIDLIAVLVIAIVAGSDK